MFFLMTTVQSAQSRAQDRDQLLDELIPRTAAGDMGAFEQLYILSKSAVYGFAMSILKSTQSAEDVMQEAYIRIHGAAGGYRPQGKPMAWILTITRNLALMKLRERQAERFEEWKAGPQPADFTEKSLDRMALEAAVSVLSDEERQIVILHAITGLKHRELAELLDMPLPTVLSKYRRALSKLEKSMKEGC